MVKKIVAVASALTLAAIFTAVPSNADSRNWRADFRAVQFDDSNDSSDSAEWSAAADFGRSIGAGSRIGASRVAGPDTCC